MGGLKQLIISDYRTTGIMSDNLKHIRDSGNSIFHVSRIPYSNFQEITLKPGKQNAEGIGVYFSEKEFRISAAEGCKGIPGMIFRIDNPDSGKFWRSKNSVCKKYGRPRTWVYRGSIKLVNIRKIDSFNGIPIVTGIPEY